MSRDLLADTAELVGVPSVSYHEAQLADRVEGQLRTVPWLQVDRVDNNVVARTALGRDRRLIVGGHLDTVPANGNEAPRIDGDELWGLGAADMKAGLAVMLALAAEVDRPSMDLTFVFYACEEVARADNGLLRLFGARPELLAADAAVLAEPTGARVQAGCQGVIKAEVTVTGERAHSARPWLGVNAIHRLAPVVEVVAAFAGRQPVVEGCRYREALQAVGVRGGVAGNVVPDRATVTLNHRFAPDRSAEQATEALRTLLAPALDAGRGDTIEIIDEAPAAPPRLGDPTIARLVAASGHSPEAKLGWTDVAFFAERGIPATNFGPGDPSVAHAAAERVSRRDLETVHQILTELIS
jgi:succinyl-diaminopimelate desuccinylase